MAAKSNKKKILIWGSIIVLIVVIILAVTKKKGTNGIKVTTETAQERTIVETVSANGKIQPEVEVKISPYISGEVVDLYVKEGDEVENGQLLAKIDPEIYISNYERTEASLQMQKANLANSKARLAQAQAQFVKSEEDFKRNKQLFEQDVISQSDFDAATSVFEVAKQEVTAARENVKAAEFSVNSTKASLREAKENLTRTAIYAPNNGTVSRLNVEKGERVTGASQFSSGTEIMRIANLERMVVDVEVNENDIVRVSLNDTCIVEVDAYLNEKFKGLITEIATSANITGVSADQVTNFEVKILLLKDSYKNLIKNDSYIKSPFRPGMSATVDIQTETANNILTVPIQAVTTRADTSGKISGKKDEGEEGDENEESDEDEIINKEDEELQEYVFLYADGKAKLQKVKTGIQDNIHIQIVEGLEDEQEVIVGPYRAVSKKLKNGDEVKKVDKKDLFKKD
ncbi:MAG: efflux RND transporter periplasmic adaptor subunit [Bacteroidales bacterium]|nr:efflux RND transporter periplasmic adaptor subunit [Bacteroidales bacterium]